MGGTLLVNGVNLEQGNYSASNGKKASSETIMRNAEYIPLKTIFKMNLQSSRHMSHFYVYDKNLNFLARLSPEATPYPRTAFSYETIIADYPTAEYVNFNLQARGSSDTPVTPETIDQIGLEISCTKDYVEKSATSEYFSISDAEYNQSFDFIIHAGENRGKNMIISCRAEYTGEGLPTIYFLRRWKNPTTGSMGGYYTSARYIMCEKNNSHMKQWRLPPYFDGAEEYTTAYVTIPEGGVLKIKEMRNTYDDSITRCNAGIHLNAHGYSGFGGPFNTLIQAEMAARLGYRYCIVIPKVTKNGVYVFLHDDDNIQSSARNPDGSQIAQEYQNRPISDFTYDELLAFDFGIARGVPFAGQKIPLLSEFLKICARTGMHPMFSVHPNLDGHWENIKAMAKKYGVLDKLNIKSGNGSSGIGVPMSVLRNDVESYTVDLNATQIAGDIDSQIATFNSILTTNQIDRTKCRCGIEFMAEPSSAQIQAVLNAGFFAGSSYHGSSAVTMQSLIEQGVTEFTEDFNASYGLNW